MLGGLSDGHGADEDALREEQLPLPQGPHPEGRDHQAHLQRGGTLLQYYSSINFLDFESRASVYEMSKS